MRESRLPLTRLMARFVADTDERAIGAQARRAAVLAIADCIGCGLAGVVCKPAQIVRGFIADVQGTAPVWLSGQRSAGQYAALANGVAAHAHALDDTQESMRGHPSAAIVPAVFAVGDEVGASGHERVTAYVFGVEIAAKLGRVVNDAHARLGWHTTGTLGVVGAAAACCRLLGLGTEQVENALGLAAGLAAGMRVNFGSMTKALQVGVTAQNGVFAARLAQRGMTASPVALEGREGFLQLFCGDAAQPERALPFGKPFEVLDPGLVFKRFPNCSLMHTSIDMVLAGLEEGVVHPEQVVEVRSRISLRLDAMRLHSSPTQGEEAKFSQEYALAATLLRGHLNPADFTGAAIDDASVRSMMKRISVELTGMETRNDGDYAELEIIHRNAPAYRAAQAKPRGHPSNPFTVSDLEEKYRQGVEPTIGRLRGAAIWSELLDLDRLDCADIDAALAHA